MSIDKYIVWKIISYSWTEIGIDDDECLSLVRKANITSSSLKDIDQIFFRDVCASFAVESFLFFPLMLWMLMPDWGYDTDYLRKRIENWYSRPYWRHLINPLRIFGYPMALVFAFRYRSMLRRAVLLNERTW